jgi:alpha-ribazole phosphatase/probable phosphoglycerate mutase
MSVGYVTTIDLLRHGEPEGGQRYRGTVDDPLSVLGWDQLRAAVQQPVPWQIIVSSPLRRCAAFAEALAAERGLPLELEPGFREMGFGEWEGRTTAEIEAATPGALGRFWEDPVRHPPPGGETLPECAGRVTAAWLALLRRHAGRHILLVGHGGMIRLVLQQVLDMPLERIWRLEVPYACRSRIRVYGTGADAVPLLVSHGHTAELQTDS